MESYWSNIWTEKSPHSQDVNFKNMSCMPIICMSVLHFTKEFLTYGKVVNMIFKEQN